MRFSGKVAVILGASASGGTGWAIAEAFAAEGAKVVVAARRREPLEVLAGKIGGTAAVCDAAKSADIAALAEVAVETYGHVDIAVNVAARPVMGEIASAPLHDIQRSLDVNFIGQVSFVRVMAAVVGDGGSILLISTASAIQPAEGMFPYACAKAATDCLVRYAAAEYGVRRITVNSILPGPIKSDMAAHIFMVPGAEQVFEREIPLGRVGLPRDFADAALALAAASYVTGVNLPVGGGIHLRRMPRSDEFPGGKAFRA